MQQLAAYPGPEAVAALVAGLEDSPPVMDAALHSLIKIGGERVARAVVPLLSHAGFRQRSAALDVLLGVGDAAGPVMVQLLAHPDRELRKMAAEVLAQTRYRAACPVLVQLVADPDPVVRAAAVAALASLGYAEAAPVLLRRLECEPEEWVRLPLAGAIARLGDASHIAALGRLAGSGPMADLVSAELAQREDLSGATGGES